MKPSQNRRWGLTIGAALLAVAGTGSAQDAAKPNPLDFSGGEAPTDFLDALASGTVSLNIRARSSYADVRGFEDSWANTVRTRVGYLTQGYAGFQAYVEGENVAPLDNNRYNAAGLNGQPGRTVIADPEVTELNQLWARYALPLEDIELAIKPGRQVIALDDQRFVGHVGWRQDNQTFDAVTLTSDLGVEGLHATYAYLWRINRIFGDERDFDSDSHLIHAAYDLEGIGTLTGFAYLLDFRSSSPVNSSQTYGLRFDGKRDLNDEFAVNYQASIATQSDYADNPVDYDAIYYLVDAGLVVKGVGTFGAGYEVLGSDDGAFAFRTPLATGHKFNGYADVFLVTPADGLRDTYIYFSPANLPGGTKGRISYHWFAGDDSIGSFGQEIDAVLTHQVNDRVTLAAKYAYFLSDQPGFAERTRLTFDVTWSF